MNHGATIHWSLGDGDMPSGHYSRAYEARFDGGAVVPGSASPGVVRAPWSKEENVDPEEMFVASIASCHMLWFLDLARKAGFVVESYTDEADGVLERCEDGKFRVTKVTLNQKIVWRGDEPDAAKLAELNHGAHERCFIANSTTAEIVIAGGEG